MTKIRSNNKRRSDDVMDQSFVSDEIQSESDASVVISTHVDTTQEMKAYINALKANKNKMAALVHDLMNTTMDEVAMDASQEDNGLNGIFVWEKITGEPPRLECGEPLTVEIPTRIADITHVINDTFSGHLCRDLPGNKRKLFDSPELKKHLSLIENIRRAEKDVMEVQERLLKAVHNNSWIALKPWNVANYSLLQYQRMVAYNNTTEKKESVVNQNEKTKIYGIHEELRRVRMRLNKERPKLNIKYRARKTTTGQCNMMVAKPEDTVHLSVNTNLVRFTRFKVGAVYKKTIIVTNSGKRMVSFIIDSHNNSVNDVFHYDFTPLRMLAPGLNTKITVTYTCVSMEDEYELMRIITKDGTKTNVVVCAENAISILTYIFDSYDMKSVLEAQTHRDLSAETLCVFECNACLVGATKTTVVMVKNTGRSGKFICVPEDLWYTESVENVEWTNTVSLEMFSITPSIFKLDSGQSMALNVTFKPLLPSFYCTRFIIVSDSSCAHEGNVFGDGQMFDRREIRLEGRDLQSTEQDRPGSYVLDMGKIGETVRYVYVKNTSRIVYPYHWVVVNHGAAIVKSRSSENAKVNFHIHPSTGLLDKISDTMFSVRCGVTDEIVDEELTGTYHVTATMMIDGIPKESITDRDVIFEEHEDSPEIVSVKIAEIEVILEYTGKEPISLSVEPKIVDLNWYTMRTDMCVQETVKFVNNGTCPVYVSWIPDFTGHLQQFHTSVTVDPKSIEVVKTAIVHVRVEPDRPGRLRETLKFRTENRDGNTGETEVYVRGVVEGMPDVCFREVEVKAMENICTGTPVSYDVEFRVRSDRVFDVQRQLFDFSAHSETPHGEVESYGPYGNNDGNEFLMTLNFQIPMNTEKTGISCQLAEWSFAAGGSKTVCYTQAVAYVKLPDAHLNVNAITIAKSLYKGISYRQDGIRLINNTNCDFVYSWGNPTGSDANNMDCVFKPSNGTVNGNSSVEFELTMTPMTCGHVNQYVVPCFVQCDDIKPQQITIECLVKDFMATITYVDAFGEKRTVVCQNNQCMFNNGKNNLDEIGELESEFIDETEFIENQISTKNSVNSFNTTEYSQESFETRPEKLQEPAKWHLTKQPIHDPRFVWLPGAAIQQEFGPLSNYDSLRLHPAMAFKNAECNTAMEQRITVRNTTEIPCRVKTKVHNYYDGNEWSTTSSINRAESSSGEGADVLDKCCLIWIERNDEVLVGPGEFHVSVWVLTTAWGRYEDMLTIEFHVDDDVLPVIYIPIIIQAVTFPIEFPIAVNVHRPTVKFSLYSNDMEYRLQILNNSVIPVHVSWRIYNESDKKRPFGVVFDTITPDVPNLWSLKIDRYYGTQFPRYFTIKPPVLKLEPKEQSYVTFFLDRTKEEYIYRNKYNTVYAKAVGTVTALKLSGNYCTREDGFKLKPAIVELKSETRHSIYPKLILRETDNVFKVSASQIYISGPPFQTTVTRMFTMINLLRYPTNISFYIDKPFTIISLTSIRYGNLPIRNSNLCVFYEDLIKIELQASISMTTIHKPKIPEELMSFRKHVEVGHLYAICENSYYQPKMISPFEVHVYFPVLKLSPNTINFGQVAVRETKSIEVMLSSYPGPERFFTIDSEYQEFKISPTEGVVSQKPVLLTITFRPETDKWYSDNIRIGTMIPKEYIYLNLSGFGTINSSENISL